jgi:hypothetical protein
VQDAIHPNHGSLKISQRCIGEAVSRWQVRIIQPIAPVVILPLLFSGLNRMGWNALIATGKILMQLPAQTTFSRAIQQTVWNVIP